MKERFECKEVGEQGTSTRRDFLFAAVILALGLSTRSAIAQQANPPNVEVKILGGISEITPFERVQNIETGMAVFRNRILPEMDLYVENPKMRERVASAFKAFGDNMKNPSRANQEAKDVTVSRPIGFSYAFDLSHDSESIMLFTQLTRQMHLSPDFDEGDFGSMAFLMHELFHVVQDDEYRVFTPPERYMQFVQTGGTVCVPEHEAQAIAVQVEVANVASKGKLKEAAKRYPDNLPKTSRNPDLDKWLKKYVVAYFTKNPADFVEFVRKQYKQVDGVKFFNANLTPME